MSKKPIFCVTHPRACSSAFERVFLTRSDMTVFHEPFGEPFYHSRERMGSRYEEDLKQRKDVEYGDSTYGNIFDAVLTAAEEDKRVFIKDMAYYFFPEHGKAASVAPSLVNYRRGVGTAMNGTNGVAAVKADEAGPPFPYGTEAEPGNPTVVPSTLLEKFHFTFLIRHPRSSIPSWVRCTVPPLDGKTGFYDFMPCEAGYEELVRFFNFVRSKGFIGDSSSDSPIKICVLDADDMLDEPEGMLRAYCRSIDLDFSPAMLEWDNDEDQQRAQVQFEKWPGFHDDALESTGLVKRTHKKKVKSDAELYAGWVETFGEDLAKVIRSTVEENTPHYEYLKQFALPIEGAATADA